MRHGYQASILHSPKSYTSTKPLNHKQMLISLLKQCKIASHQINKLEAIDDQRQIFHKGGNILKSKFEELIRQNRSLQDQIQLARQENQNNIHKLSQISDLTNQYKIKQSTLKLLVENAQKQWENANQMLIKARTELDDLDDQMFLKSKQCSNALLQNKSLNRNIEILSNELKQTIINSKEKEKQMETVKENFRLQQYEIFKILQIKEEEIQQLILKNNYTQQEYEIIQREYIRWKERYELQSQSYQNNQRRENRPQEHSNYNIRIQRPEEVSPNEERVKELHEQIRELSEKFRQATEQKMRLYGELQQIKEILWIHGIEYDKVQDAPLIQVMRRQRQSSRQNYRLPRQRMQDYPNSFGQY